MNDNYKNIIDRLLKLNFGGKITKNDILNALSNQDKDKLEKYIEEINNDVEYFDEEGGMKDTPIEVLGLIGEELTILSSKYE